MATYDCIRRGPARPEKGGVEGASVPPTKQRGGGPSLPLLLGLFVEWKSGVKKIKTQCLSHFICLCPLRQNIVISFTSIHLTEAQPRCTTVCYLSTWKHAFHELFCEII